MRKIEQLDGLEARLITLKEQEKTGNAQTIKGTKRLIKETKSGITKTKKEIKKLEKRVLLASSSRLSRATVEAEVALASITQGDLWIY
jgi:spermidine/putrescine-binding protein